MNTRTALTTIAAALALAGAGCGDTSTTYSYFVVSVTVDRQSVDLQLLDLVASCAAIAHTPSGDDSTNLPCPRGHIRTPDFGKFEYTTTLTSGAVSFTVVMNGINGNPLAQGDSTPVGIVPSKTTEAALTVKALPGAVREPPAVVAGADGGSAAD